MAKMSGSKNRRKRSDNDHWSSVDHAERLRDSKDTKKARITAFLTHNTLEKRNSTRLNLLITKAQRSVNDLRKRLVAWDAISEKQLFLDVQLAKEKRRKEIEGEIPTKKKGRLGPETWKLRGAARPAWDVYDFDVRYQDPYLKAHEEAKIKAKRCVNLLLMYKGKCGDLMKQPQRDCHDTESMTSDHHITLIHIKEYLSLLMDLGFLSYEAKQHKTARSVWLECIELEGRTAVTSARESLFKMYIELQKYESVLNLYSEYESAIFESDNSSWLRFSVALASFHVNEDASANGKQRQYGKKGSKIAIIHQDERTKAANSKDKPFQSESSTSDLMVQAIKSNIFCAYFISFYETIFSTVMEYTDEIEDMQNNKDEGEPESTFEESLDYCFNGEKTHLKLWLDSGAARTLRDTLSRNEAITTSDIEWDNRLKLIVEHYLARRQGDPLHHDNVDHEYDDTSKTFDTNSHEKAECHEKEDCVQKTAQGSVEGKAIANDDNAADGSALTVDIPMFAEMFRTGMEMLLEAKLVPGHK